MGWSPGGRTYMNIRVRTRSEIIHVIQGWGAAIQGVPQTYSGAASLVYRVGLRENGNGMHGVLYISPGGETVLERYPSTYTGAFN